MGDDRMIRAAVCICFQDDCLGPPVTPLPVCQVNSRHTCSNEHSSLTDFKSKGERVIEHSIWEAAASPLLDGKRGGAGE